MLIFLLLLRVILSLLHKQRFPSFSCIEIDCFLAAASSLFLFKNALSFLNSAESRELIGCVSGLPFFVD